MAFEPHPYTLENYKAAAAHRGVAFSVLADELEAYREPDLAMAAYLRGLDEADKPAALEARPEAPAPSKAVPPAPSTPQAKA